ncbi:hypothetical protein QQ045_013997 [Rhodiola kirilowii]
MTSIASWNIRGLHNPSKQKEVRHFIEHFDIGLLAVLEVKLRGDASVSIVHQCCPSRNRKSLSFVEDQNALTDPWIERTFGVVCKMSFVITKVCGLFVVTLTVFSIKMKSLMGL